ncbi:unnamed protein product [Adineta ricciae]|uniref:Uncharacterized protein n=1 Tax=Adineta ricciae TaxID=249248 RepID=A0A816EV74_ADIRI|nr:unnamed protein product [Adineta ricciae]CAF1652337.1 unnamed protein product [Adineta ricciae]
MYTSSDNYWNYTMLMESYYRDLINRNYLATQLPRYGLHMQNPSYYYPSLDGSRLHFRSNLSSIRRGSSRNNQRLATHTQTYRGPNVIDNVVMIGVPFVANGLMAGVQLEPQGSFSGGFDHVFGQISGFGDFDDTGSDLIDMFDVGGDMFDLVGDFF